MIICYHGSPNLFKAFDLSKAGTGTGIKFGAAVSLSEAFDTAVHYSQPGDRPGRPHHEMAKDHYIYTVEIPDLTDDNHVFSLKPVHPNIIERTEAKLGQPIPQRIAQKGTEFLKWVGMACIGSKEVTAESKKAAATFLDSIGVFCNVWPQAQTKPNGLRNFAVYDAAKIHILKCEHIEIVRKGKKYVLVEGSRKEIKVKS